MKPNETKWNQLRPFETNWYQVKSNETKRNRWNQIKTNETNGPNLKIGNFICLYLIEKNIIFALDLVNEYESGYWKSCFLFHKVFRNFLYIHLSTHKLVVCHFYQYFCHIKAAKKWHNQQNDYNIEMAKNISELEEQHKK